MFTSTRLGWWDDRRAVGPSMRVKAEGDVRGRLLRMLTVTIRRGWWLAFGRWQDDTRGQNPMPIAAGAPPGLADARAVASPPTTPIPVVRPRTNHPVDVSATTPLPVVPSGPLQQADAAAAEPQEQTGIQRSPWKTLRARTQRSEAPSDVASAESEPSPAKLRLPVEVTTPRR